ncbi:MAG TPA: helix-turn-helix transcriptional regulator [Rubrobacteraceae bacterium]|nr:helix-turn-helix transcriptional regulator [Rubrobacteraceae bacterium]
MQLPRTREWREAAGLTQRQLSEESGVAKGTIVRIENGESATPRTAKKVADTLNISVTDLLESPPVPLGQAPTSSEPAEEAEESKERREELLEEERGLSEVHLLQELAAIAMVAKDFARRWEEESRARITEGDFPWERSMEIQLAALGLIDLFTEKTSAYQEVSDNVNWDLLAELDKRMESMIEAKERATKVAAALQARHSKEPSAEQASVSEAANRHLRLVV